MRTHPDDADLLAVAHRRRPASDRLLRHLDGCAVCRGRVEDLARLLPVGLPMSAIPPWSQVRPQCLGRRAGRRLWVPIVLAVAALLIGLPKLMAPKAPWGIEAAIVWAAGRTALLHPVSAATGVVQLKWDRTTGWALLTAVRVPPLTRGQVYEVWWIHGTRHSPAGTFVPSRTGSVAVWLLSPSHFTGVDAVGITREPSPGTEHPTGPREYAAPLGNPSS
ncbi:MAG: anti-sigma factor domain-containing protein [Clostridia bacterium]